MKNDYGHYGSGLDGYVHYRQAMKESEDYHRKHPVTKPITTHPHRTYRFEYGFEEDCNLNPALEDVLYKSKKDAHFVYESRSYQSIDGRTVTRNYKRISPNDPRYNTKEDRFNDEYALLTWLQQALNERGFDSFRYIDYMRQHNRQPKLANGKFLLSLEDQRKTRAHKKIEKWINVFCALMIVSAVFLLVFIFATDTSIPDLIDKHPVLAGMISVPTMLCLALLLLDRFY